MSEAAGVTYTKVDKSYFEQRGLRRYAGVWSLWALGVGAVISGHFSGWNFGSSLLKTSAGLPSAVWSLRNALSSTDICQKQVSM